MGAISHSRSSLRNFHTKLTFFNIIKLSAPYQITYCRKGRLIDSVNKSFFTRNDPVFHFNNNVQISLEKIKSKDFCQRLDNETHTGGHAGPKRWSENLSLNDGFWRKVFKSLRKVYKETRLKEFQFKSVHRIVVNECCFCGDRDSTDHSFIDLPRPQAPV